MLKHKKHKCELCGEPTDLQGWYFAVRTYKNKHKASSLKKEYHWWCSEHFCINMFNLWPYSCIKKCRERHTKLIGIKLSKKEYIVWLSLESTLIPVSKKKNPTPMKSLAPKCPWCSKGMRLVKSFLD